MQLKHELQEEPTDASVDLGLLARNTSVPVLPLGSAELFSMLGDPESSFDEIVSTLQNFPTVVARLIALANSPWSSPAAPVISLEAAVSRLGLGIVRSISVALLVSSPFNVSRCGNFDGERFWCTALMSSRAAARLVSHLPPEQEVPVTSATTAGLIGNLGLLWLADALPEQTNLALVTAAQHPLGTVDKALLDTCGISLGDAGAVLADLWNLPPQLVDAMSCHKFAEDAESVPIFAAVTSTANRLASDVYAHRQRPHDDHVRAQLGIDGDVFEQTRADLEAALPSLSELAASLFH